MLSLLSSLRAMVSELVRTTATPQPIFSLQFFVARSSCGDADMRMVLGAPNRAGTIDSDAQCLPAEGSGAAPNQWEFVTSDRQLVERRLHHFRASKKSRETSL